MKKLTDPSAAVRMVPKGKRIFIGSGAAAPLALIDALAQNANHFRDNEVVHLLTLGESGFVDPQFESNFRDNSFFIGPNVRRAVQDGYADYTPIFLSEIPRLLRSSSFPISAALVSVSPPDAFGMCSLGVSVDIVKAALESAALTIAQINHRMPRTFGQTFVPYAAFDYVVDADMPLPELTIEQPDAAAQAIGAHIAALIADGDVLQLGIGSIPNAVLALLGAKNDLGLHTEMFSDGVIDLIKNGNITNNSKKVMRGRTLTSFCLGSKNLYDFVHENPLIEFYPSDFVNDPMRIAENDRMIAINSALQVDLTGQVCADSIGRRFYSGIGGQVDFMRGASRSRGGKPIIALPATAKGGTVSRIVGELFAGAGVVTSRGDVHYVITEFGVAHLFGKTVRQRAMELISVAHPDFRDELLAFVKEHKYVYFDQMILDRKCRYPAELEENRTFAEEQFRVRPVKITDEEKLQEFFYSHSERTLYLRYSHTPTAMPHSRAHELTHIDYQTQMAIVILKEGEFDDRIVAIGRYSGSPGSDTAELAFVVAEEYQGKGMGSYLCGKLQDHARTMGIATIKMYVLLENYPMRRVIEKLTPPAGKVRFEIDGTMITYTIDMPQGANEPDNG